MEQSNSYAQDKIMELFSDVLVNCKESNDLYRNNPVDLPPDVIWHYTSLDGLKGILSSRSLWMTNAQYMNDVTELIYGAKIVLQELQRNARAFFGDVNYSKLIVNYETYVACFCRRKNLLSQWARYARNGAGVSIGFRLSELQKIFSDYIFVSVEYSDMEQRNLFNTYLMHFCGLLSKHTDANVRAAAICRLSHIVVAACKHPDFSEEQEIRLIISPDAKNKLGDKIKVRVSGDMLVPYLETDIDISGAIKEIMVGPNRHQSENRKAVKRLLGSCKYQNEIDVTFSETPLR